MPSLTFTAKQAVCPSSGATVLALFHSMTQLCQSQATRWPQTIPWESPPYADSDQGPQTRVSLGPEQGHVTRSRRSDAGTLVRSILEFADLSPSLHAIFLNLFRAGMRQDSRPNLVISWAMASSFRRTGRANACRANGHVNSLQETARALSRDWRNRSNKRRRPAASWTSQDSTQDTPTLSNRGSVRSR